MRTAYSLKVNEVFRDTAGATLSDKRLEVIQIGGERDRGDHIESVTDPTFQRLRAHERFVFFLKPSPAGNGMSVMATADSAFALTNVATVDARGRSRLALQVERYTHEEFLTVLRKVSRSTPKHPNSGAA